jgi:hypothetical protein
MGEASDEVFCISRLECGQIRRRHNPLLTIEDDVGCVGRVFARYCLIPVFSLSSTGDCTVGDGGRALDSATRRRRIIYQYRKPSKIETPSAPPTIPPTTASACLADEVEELPSVGMVVSVACDVVVVSAATELLVGLAEVLVGEGMAVDSVISS